MTLARRSDTVEDVMAEAGGGCRGPQWTLMDDPPHIHTGAGTTKAGMEGGQPTIMGLEWHA